jgi:hypothetical protein
MQKQNQEQHHQHPQNLDLEENYSKRINTFFYVLFIFVVSNIVLINNGSMHSFIHFVGMAANKNQNNQDVLSILRHLRGNYNDTSEMYDDNDNTNTSEIISINIIDEPTPYYYERYENNYSHIPSSFSTPTHQPINAPTFQPVTEPTIVPLPVPTPPPTNSTE